MVRLLEMEKKFVFLFEYMIGSWWFLSGLVLLERSW